MAKLTYREKLPNRSVQAVRDLYDDALCLHQRARKVMFGQRRITAEAFTNAAMLWFLLAHDFEEQEKILLEYVPKFEQMVAGEEPAPQHLPDEKARAKARHVPGEPTPKKGKGGRSGA